MITTRALLTDLFHAAIRASSAGVVMAGQVPADPPRGGTIVLGCGKAAAAMAAAARAQITGPVSGCVVTRYGHGLDQPVADIDIVEAGHPVPDAAGTAAAERIMALARQAGPDDRVLFVISGGGSALLCAPAPGITLADKRAITDHLVRSGAPIAAINLVRRHLSAVKGGRLGALAGARGAQLHTLIISDVVGDDPATVASGPSIAAPFEPDRAIDLLQHHGWHVDAALAAAIRANAPAMVPTHGTAVLANGRTAIDAVIARVHDRSVVDLGDGLTGEARTVGAAHAELARNLAARGGRHLIVSGGELTVTAPGRDGCGGPNLEYLAGLARGLLPGDPVAALAGDTDGIDGSEDNAGGFVTPGVFDAAALDHALATHRTHALFAAHDALVMTGPTRTNVNDLRLILVG
jgi:hydroxypyruvate reductase